VPNPILLFGNSASNSNNAIDASSGRLMFSVREIRSRTCSDVDGLGSISAHSFARVMDAWFACIVAVIVGGWDEAGGFHGMELLELVLEWMWEGGRLGDGRVRRPSRI
jgi:hypothetical protein